MNLGRMMERLSSKQLRRVVEEPMLYGGHYNNYGRRCLMGAARDLAPNGTARRNLQILLHLPVSIPRVAWLLTVSFFRGNTAAMMSAPETRFDLLVAGRGHRRATELVQRRAMAILVKRQVKVRERFRHSEAKRHPEMERVS